ncbi:hypothetical protein RND71_028773 [Anisodus tanguticus]|uniref:HMA domain-containing protein n=1 Tax=Anisodus tanguticus TaxID=243964 RepID=A0AAE1RJ10_9SOLA|nr:hypothetical protein RND71_028773 [Anisodus tanguticus]
MEHQAPQPDCIIKIEAIGCCENCAKRVRKKLVRLEGVYSVEIDRERRWVYISGDIELQLLMNYLTRRSVNPESVKLIYYCSKEARSDKHHAKNQAEYTPMENKSERPVKNNLPKETYYQKNMASDHAKNIPSKDNCPMQNNNSKREGENCNQDSSHHHTRGDYDPNHYALRKDWVHKAENYIAQPQKQDQHPSDDCGCMNPSCDFHAWKRYEGRGSSSSSHFDFDRVPRAAHMRSASARWLREDLPLFYGYLEPIMPLPRLPGQFPYI